MTKKTERLRSECVRCVLGNYLKGYPEEASEKERLEYMQKVLKLLGTAPKETSAPVIVREINLLQKEMFGITNAYGEIKEHFNEVMLGFEPEIRGGIQASEEPLKTAAKYAMVGNYIDFGAMKNVDEEYLAKLLGTASSIEVDTERFGQLKNELVKARNLLYLTDNCGEIVMDKLFIEQLQRLYPKLYITVMVRGAAVINDATLEDAVQVGLLNTLPEEENGRLEVIGNGTDIAGTCLEALPPEVLEIVHQADVILSKGQGNYETLRGCGLNIFYLFLCKCDMFAKEFNVPKMTGMLVRE